MSGKKEIDDAFKALYADDDAWDEILNLYSEDLKKDDKQYFFDKVEQLCTEKVDPREFMRFLRWAITEQLDVSKDAIDKLGLLFLSSDCSTESGLALEIAKFYCKETYKGDEGEPFDNPEKVKKWISISFDLASDPVDYMMIIEHVAQEYGCLHLGDKSWGQELLKQVKSKADDKTFKKVERGVKSTLA